MGFFVLSSDITIGKFRFRGVNDVRIARSIHSFVDSAIIKLPSISKIIKNGKVSPDAVITGKQFSDGDPVTIRLGYGGASSVLQTEFKGFVKRRNLDMPLEVECEGYSWLLRRNNVNHFYPTVSIKDLLIAAVDGIDNNYKITVQCDLDFELRNVAIDNKCGLEVLNLLSKYTDDCLTCFFIQPDVLWCGLVYSAYANGGDPPGFAPGNSVKYRLGYNTVKDNSLKERITENDPVEVAYSKKLSNGTIVSATSDVFPDAKRKESRILNHVADAATLSMLANEKAYQCNYLGYEGAINGFCEPFCQPGYRAYITDDRYPERNGTYLVEGTEVIFGVGGARRTVEVGPFSGFIKS